MLQKFFVIVTDALSFAARIPNMVSAMTFSLQTFYLLMTTWLP